MLTFLVNWVHQHSNKLFLFLLKKKKKILSEGGEDSLPASYISGIVFSRYSKIEIPEIRTIRAI
jgi:hypothetical protein